MDWKNGLKKAADTARDTARDTVDGGRLALEVRRAKAEANAVRLELADRVLERFEDGAELPSELAEKCAELADAEERADKLRQDLEAVKLQSVKRIRSIDWGAVLGKKAEPELFCPECGRRMKESYVFCPGCGTRLENVDDLAGAAEMTPPEGADEAAAAGTPEGAEPEKAADGPEADIAADAAEDAEAAAADAAEAAAADAGHTGN